jgi:galactose oxidase
MNIPRGYQSQATLGDGRTFVIGGSWSGGRGGKIGEIYSPATNSWARLPSCPVGPMLTADVQGVYRADNHAWLFNWKNGYVLQAGPSKQMNWYNTAGAGGQAPAGTRAADGHAMCGNAVMYDASAGKILTVGGSPNYQASGATANANLLTVGNPDVPVTATGINNMYSPRIFHNSVVLPNGQVFITGGQTIGSPFYDSNSILTPEMWTPSTTKFVQMTPNSIPRNYHSTALLLTDATVVSCGGGLCGTCSTNHFDCQIYTPPYLLNADGSKKARPTISSVSATANAPGDTITVSTDIGCTSFSIIRYGSNTHTVNTDQRRIPLTPTTTGTNTYKITLGPADTGVVTPGYWMLFGISAAGVPSLATTLHIQ